MTSSPAPLSLRLATLLVAVETVVVWVFVAVLGIAAVDERSAAVTRVLGYFAIYAVALPVLGWALFRRRRWVRAPLIVVQILWVGVGLTMLSTRPVVGGVVVVLAVLCVGFLLTPGVRAAIGAR